MESLKNYQIITKNEDFKRCKKCKQHGDYSVYDHSLNVAGTCLLWSDILHLKIDRESLVKVALLHDYFMYDWHEKGHPRLHGFRHANFAAENAKRDFGLTKKEENAIRAHMFPLGKTLPKSKEALLLTCADKYCATRETISGVPKKVKKGAKKIVSAPKKVVSKIKQ